MQPDAQSLADDRIALLSSKIRSLNLGSNLFCWPLFSFGMDNADLFPRGCTGIRSVRSKDDQVIIEIGGHRTFKPLSGQKQSAVNTYIERATDLIRGCGYVSVALGTDWSVYEDVEIIVPWVRDESGVYDIEQTAKNILVETEKFLEPFCEEMSAISEILTHEFESAGIGPEPRGMEPDWQDPPGAWT